MLILDLLTLIQIVEHFKPSSYGQDSRRVNNGFLKLRAFQLTHRVKILQTSWVGAFWAKTESKLLTLLIISGHAQLSRQLWVYGLQKLCPRPLCFRFPFLSICCDKEKQHIEKWYWELGHSCEKPDYMVLVLLYCFWGQEDVGIFVCLLVLKEFNVRVLVAVQETVGMKFQISWRGHCISLKRRHMDTHPWPKKYILLAFKDTSWSLNSLSFFHSFFLSPPLALFPFFSFFLFPVLTFRNGTRSAGMASDHFLYIISTTQQLICKRPVCGFSRVGGWVLILHEKILFSLFFTFS